MLAALASIFLFSILPYDKFHFIFQFELVLRVLCVLLKMGRIGGHNDLILSRHKQRLRYLDYASVLLGDFSSRKLSSRQSLTQLRMWRKAVSLIVTVHSAQSVTQEFVHRVQMLR